MSSTSPAMMMIFSPMLKAMNFSRNLSIPTLLMKRLSDDFDDDCSCKVSAMQGFVKTLIQINSQPRLPPCLLTSFRRLLHSPKPERH
jgi:hypothetical protein